jgi:signal transduction histidine kinase
MDYLELKEKEFSLNDFFFGSLQKKIFSLVFLFIVFLLILVPLVYYQNKAVFREEIFNHIQTISNDRVNIVNLWLKEQHETLHAISSSVIIYNFLHLDKSEESYLTSLDDVNKRILSFKEGDDDVYRVNILNSDGIVITSTDENKIGVNKSYILEEIRLTGLEFEIVQEEGENTPSLRYLSEVRDGNNLIGYILIYNHLDYLYSIMVSNLKLGVSGESYLVNSQRVLLSPLKFENLSFLSIVTSENIEACLIHFNKSISPEELLKRHSEFESRGILDYRGERVLGTHTPISELSWCLITEIDEIEAMDSVYSLRDLFLVVFSLFTIILFISGYILSRKISEPITELTKAAEAIGTGKLNVKTNITSNDEFGELGRIFNETRDILARTQKDREQIDKAKTEFLSITSHELRSPMTPMKAQMEMLLRGYFGKLNKAQKEALLITANNTTRLDKIIADFLEISRIEAARLKFNFIKVSLNDTVESVVKEMNNFMSEKNVKVELDKSNLPVMEVDPDRVSQVLRNLVNNAIKFSPDNSKVLVNVKLRGSEILFSVRDYGIGMSEDDLSRIFEPFFQAEQTIYRKYQGAGLGLAICRGIVESQGGKIWVVSKKGKGSNFYFTWPLKPVKEIKSIKLLFSSQRSVESGILEVFKEILGPLGRDEFEDLKIKHELSKEKLFKYVNILVRQGIVDKSKGIEFKAKLARVFGVEYSPKSLTKKIKRWVDEF